MQLTRRRILESKKGQFFLFLLAGGALSLWKRKDVNWDLQNYHLYNPWAWLHDRLDYDLAPAQMQSYLSPLLDVPFYLLVRADVHPMLIGFLMGLPVGVALAGFFWIVRLACEGLPRRDALAITCLSLLVGMTGAAGLATVGSTMNEWHTAALVMPALYLALRLSLRGAKSVRAWLVPGLLLGAAAGLKFTAAPYGIAVAVAAASVQVLSRRAPWTLLTGLAAGGTVGFLATYGYWGMLLAQQFQSPMFPFFNAVFRSPDWLPVSFRDGFGPKTIVEALLFPLELARRGMAASNLAQRDPRLAVFFACLIGLVLLAFARRQDPLAPIPRAPFVFLLVFTVSAYAVWLTVFAIYRYLIPIELIASLLIVLCAWLLLQGFRWRLAVLTVLCIALVAATDRPGWGRKRFGERYFDVSAPTLPRGSLVLLYGIEPLAYLLPFLGPENRYVRPSSNFTNPAHTHGLQRRIEETIRQHAGPIYALRKPDQDLADEAAVFERYGLRRADEACLPVRSEIHAGMALCRLVRRETRG